MRMEQGDRMGEEIEETEEVTAAVEPGPQLVAHQTLGTHQVETVTVTATERAEDVVTALMSEEKKQELMARLQSLKSALDVLEEKKKLLDPPKEVVEEPKVKLSGNQMFNRVELLAAINQDLRANITAFANSDRYDAFREALEILSKSNKIYDDIISQILE